jgi:hypothetical protein
VTRRDLFGHDALHPSWAPYVVQDRRVGGAGLDDELATAEGQREQRLVGRQLGDPLQADLRDPS